MSSTPNGNQVLVNFQCQAITWTNVDCWLIVNWTTGNKLQWNSNQNTTIFIKKNNLEMLSTQGWQWPFCSPSKVLIPHHAPMFSKDHPCFSLYKPIENIQAFSTDTYMYFFSYNTNRTSVGHSFSKPGIFHPRTIIWNSIYMDKIELIHNVWLFQNGIR